jgi:CBS domain-containing protein
MTEKAVQELMTKDVITVSRDTTIGELSGILIKNNITGAPVVDENGKLVGMVTDADIITENLDPIFPIYFDPLIMSYAYIDNFEKHQRDIKDYLSTRIEEIMTRRVKTIKKDTPVRDAVRVMVKDRVNRIPVVDDANKVIGILARADVLKSMLSDSA